MSEYVVGKTYSVDTVLAQIGIKERIVPIVGPWHSDSDIIGFDPEHYHINWQFVSVSTGTLLTVLSSIRDLIQCEKSFRNMIADNPFVFTSRVLPWIKADYGVQQRRLKCLREFLPMPSYDKGVRVDFIPKLENKYRKHKAINAICPHAGGSLEHSPVVKCGVRQVRICPLHGLAWDDEGNLVKR